MMKALHKIEVRTIEGETRSLADYEGKALLIVNTASKCGFTPQFDGLEALHKEYEGRGLHVLGFPCNQFGGQDPGTNEEIGAFCRKNYGVTFPMHDKIEVNGPTAHPLYQLLKKARPGLFGTEAIKWNFTKFLVDPRGQVVERFSPKTKPSDLRRAIERVLPAAP